MRKIFSILVLIIFVNIFALAQKVATVNMEKLFNDFYKTPQIEAVLTQQGKVYQDYINKRTESMRALDKEFRVAFDRSQNVTLTQELRAKATKEAEKISSEINLIRTELTNYTKERQEAMQKLTVTKRNDLMTEIINTVRQVAINQGYDIVLDSSNKNMLNVPSVIYSKTNIDLTLDVLNILNKGNTTKKDNEK